MYIYKKTKNVKVFEKLEGKTIVHHVSGLIVGFSHSKLISIISAGYE